MSGSVTDLDSKQKLRADRNGRRKDQWPKAAVGKEKHATGHADDVRWQ